MVPRPGMKARTVIDVDGRPLQAWIAADDARGPLHSWSDGCALWTVDAEQIPAVREALIGTGMLYADTA